MRHLDNKREEAKKRLKAKQRILVFLFFLFAILNLCLSAHYLTRHVQEDSAMDVISFDEKEDIISFAELQIDRKDDEHIIRDSALEDFKEEQGAISSNKDLSTTNSRSIKQPQQQEANLDEIEKFQYSEIWLQSSKFSNINEDLATPEYVYNLILNTSPVDSNGSHDILSQSLALEGSSFRTWNVTSDPRILAHRLIYLAIHENQYGPARNEASSRKNGHDLDLLKGHNVGLFDYQCDPDTKYLVHDYVSRGSGFAHSFKSFLNLYLAAISSNRVLLSNKSKRGNYQVGCSRGDMQCIFLPFSPCVLRKEPKENVTTIDNTQYNSLLINGTIGQGYDEEKILYLPEKKTDSPYGKESSHLREKLITIIQKLLRLDDESVQASTFPWMPSNEVLNEAFNLIRTDDYIITQSAWAYLMKPNLKTQAEVDRIMDKTLPKDFNPASSFGLAVRASDKCSTGETDCLYFWAYMELVSELSWNRTVARVEKKGDKISTATSNMYDTIVLTSEDKNVLDARYNYTSNASFPFRFIVNEEDVAQGNGDPRSFHGEMNGKKWNADDVLISSIVTIKLQMHPETLVINGCSNFHRQILWHFRMMGFTSLQDAHTQTLLQGTNPKYRPRCRNYIKQF